MKYFLSILMVSVLATGFCQNNEYVTGRFYEGYLITDDGTRERGYIQYLPEADRYEKIIFKAEKKGKKKKYKFGDVAGYKVADTEYKAVEYDDVMFKGRKFLIVDQTGCLNTYHYTEYSSEDGAWNTITIFENDQGAVNSQKFALNFSKKMAELVQAQPELAEKVRNKEKGYGLLQMYKIVDEYNANCEKDK